MSQFIRDKYKDFESYIPSEQPTGGQLIKLNANEAPYPPPSEVTSAISRTDFESLRLYPDSRGIKIRERIAKEFDVGTANVAISNGSDDMLNYIVLAYGGKGILFPDITYSFYKVIAKLHDVNYRTAPLTEGMEISPNDYYNCDRTVMIANPNAPTGIALSASQIEAIVEKNSGNVVVIDEAYFGFGAETCIPLTKKYSNLLVVRTFSKSRSFAGGRLGFAIGNEALIDDLILIKNSINPYPVGTINQILAEAVLDSREYYEEKTLEIQQTREYTKKELEKIGFRVLPSQTNFLFVRSDNITGEDLCRKLDENGILVRHFDSDKIKDYNRVTIGTRAEMDAFLVATRKALG